MTTFLLYLQDHISGNQNLKECRLFRGFDQRNHLDIVKTINIHRCLSDEGAKGNKRECAQQILMWV